MKKAPLVLSALVMLMGVPASSALAVQPDAVTAARAGTVYPQITVSATGEVQRKPDYAFVHIGVEFREPTATAASERAGSAMDKVVKAIEELKLPGQQLQTSGVSLNPAYVWRSQEEPRQLLGYDAVSMLRVRCEDPKSVGKIIDAAIMAGANRIDGVSFEIKEALEARQEATRLAAQAARQKAETLAGALGLKIRSVVTATTSSDSPRPWMMAQANRVASAPSPEGLGGAVEPGLITIQAEATVTFAAE